MSQDEDINKKLKSAFICSYILYPSAIITIIFIIILFIWPYISFKNIDILGAFMFSIPILCFSMCIAVIVEYSKIKKDEVPKDKQSKYSTNLILSILLIIITSLLIISFLLYYFFILKYKPISIKNIETDFYCKTTRYDNCENKDIFNNDGDGYYPTRYNTNDLIDILKENNINFTSNLDGINITGDTIYNTSTLSTFNRTDKQTINIINILSELKNKK